MEIQPGFMDGVWYMWNKTLEAIDKNKHLPLDEFDDVINDIGCMIRDEVGEQITEQYDQKLGMTFKFHHTMVRKLLTQ